MSGYVDPHFPNPGGNNDARIIIYGYTPHLALGVLGVILFTIATILHTVQVIRFRTWCFIPIIVGCLLEVVGYIARILSSKISPYNVIFFVVQYFFIVVAPVFFSAGIYTILSMLIKRVGSQYSPISPKLILWLFIVCDIIATIVQIAGAASIGSAESNRRDPTVPNNILTAGLAFQVFTFFVYIVLSGIFLWRARKVLGDAKGFVYAVVFATIMVYLRTTFRLAESAEGVMSNLFTSETYFGCLEFLPIVLAVYTLIWWHPGKHVNTQSQLPEDR